MARARRRCPVLYFGTDSAELYRGRACTSCPYCGRQVLILFVDTRQVHIEEHRAGARADLREAARG